VRGIANISVTSYFYRDMFIEHKVDKIADIVKIIANYKLLKVCVWAISFFCIDTPLPNNELVNTGILFLCDIIGKGKTNDL
jgi:hypothetical protein